MSNHDLHWLFEIGMKWIFAENPLYSKKPSDLNWILILFVETDVIFLSKLLKSDPDFGPISGPVKCATNVLFSLESISCIDM